MKIKFRTQKQLNKRLGQKEHRKSSTILIMLLISASFIQAQNTSFNTNAIPIGGTQSTAFGTNALFANTGQNNVATGNQSLRFNTSGNANTATGFEGLYTNTTGANNTAMGYRALKFTTGSNNTALGEQSMLTNTSGDFNTALGSRADMGSANLVNATAVGYAAIVTMNDAMQLGNSSLTRVLVGVGNAATLQTGGLQVTGGTLAAGRILTSDAFGNATWQLPPSGGGSWALLGNSGTVDGTNFIGTTDNIPFTIRVNNIRAGRIDHLLRNTFFGYQSGNATTTGNYNTANGMNALATNVSGNNNTAIGYGADVGSSSLTNATAIGNAAVVTANNSIQLGNSAVTQVRAGTGTNATVIAGGLQITGGVLATGQVLTSDALGNATWQLPAAGGGGWTILGNAGTIDGTNFFGTTDNVPLNFRLNNQKAGRVDATLGNVFMGAYASAGTTYATTGSYNSAYGHNVLTANTSGFLNSAFGGGALSANTIGAYNTAIGANAMSTNINGTQNTILGAQANVASSGLTNATAIGYGATVSNNNSIQLGNSFVTEIIAGNSLSTMVITPRLKVIGGTPGVGKVLTSDAVGEATWQTPTGGGSGWSLTGNAGTNPATNFIGTTDNVPLKIRVNNANAGIIENLIGFSGCNTAWGYEANNVGTGALNTMIGYGAGKLNIGVANCALGMNALTNLNGANANYNTAVGVSALLNSTTGFHNCSFGFLSSTVPTSGSYNSAFGSTTDMSSGLTNATAIGALTTVNVSNKIRLGNAGVTVIEGSVAYTISDARFKENIRESDVVGLEFIKRLRPVVYNFNAKKFDDFLTINSSDTIRKIHQGLDFGPATAIRQSGFIAQEVEKITKEIGYDFNGLHAPENENDNYSLAYAQFVVPLVKGMQEQQVMIEDLKRQLEEQKQLTSELQKKTNATGIEQLNSGLQGFSMNQNEPNPFTHETIVRFVLPQQVTSASMVVYDLTGKQLAVFSLNDRGASSITLTSEKLAAGIYIYTIIGDGKVLDSKRMIVADK